MEEPAECSFPVKSLYDRMERVDQDAWLDAKYGERIADTVLKHALDPRSKALLVTQRTAYLDSPARVWSLPANGIGRAPRSVASDVRPIPSVQVKRH